MTTPNETEIIATIALSEAHENAKAHGWWDGYQGGSTQVFEFPDGGKVTIIREGNPGRYYLTPDEIASKFALIQGEISEALEALRDGKLEMWTDEKGKPEGAVTELGDAKIRIADLCGALRLGLAQAIVAKHEYNKGRPYRHGGKAL